MDGLLLFVAIALGITLSAYIQIFISLPLNQILKDQTDDMSIRGPKLGSAHIALMGFDKKINSAVEKSGISKFVLMGRILAIVFFVLIFYATTPISEAIQEAFSR